MPPWTDITMVLCSTMASKAGGGGGSIELQREPCNAAFFFILFASFAVYKMKSVDTASAFIYFFADLNMCGRNEERT